MGSGAEAEFSAFVHRRWSQLVRLGFVLTGDAGLAEDLAQTALARVYASWPRICRSGDPDAYVRPVMVNANRSRFRKRRVAEQLTGAVPEPSPPAGAGQVSCHPTRSYPPDAVVTVMTDRWRGLRAGITGASVAYIRLRLRNHKAARLPVIHVGRQGFWALSVLRHPGPVASWTAYDTAGHPVARGTGPPG